MFSDLALASHITDLTNNVTDCTLEIVNTEDLMIKLCKWNQNLPHIVEYSLEFESYKDSDPWTEMDNWIDDEIMDNVYKPLQYKHVFSAHGEALLSLPSNYKILSMHSLDTGVDKLNLRIEDTPKYCFRNMSVSEKLNVTFDFFFNHLLNETWRIDNAMMKEQSHKTCDKRPEKICRHTRNALWDSYQCYWLKESKNQTDVSEITCSNANGNPWVVFLFSLIDISHIYFIFFGPALLLNFYGGK